VTNSSIDTTLAIIKQTLDQEQAAGCVNDLAKLAGSQRRRAELAQHWQTIQAELAPIGQAIKNLPALPPQDQIQWAQAIYAMGITDAVRFLEVDTTGLGEESDIIRVTLVNLSGDLFDDILIKPSCPISPQASAANGLYDVDLAEAPSLPDVWERRILRGMVGRYIISFNQKFDIEQLQRAAARYGLSPITIIGDDLQRHVRAYYHNEYYLSLESICERIGHPIESKSAIDRAKGQYHILRAMVEAVTDVRPPRPPAAPKPEPANRSTSGPDADDFLSDDSLGDLDSHPF
jgi:DNA polymerase III epsilon subunit-like protein